MSDPYQSAPDNPFQPPTAPPSDPLDTPVTGYDTPGFGAPTYTTTGETAGESSGSATGAAGQAASDVASGAKDRASDVASTASEHASAVASTAQEKGREVVGEAKFQAQSLLGSVRDQLQQQTQQGHQNAHQGLRSLADELNGLVEGHGGQNGPATQLASQARDRVNDLASWLEQRQPGDLVNEVRDFGRRRPGTFLLGALVAGVAVGRLTRGAVEAHRSEGSDSTSTAVVPTDVYGTGYTTGYGTGAGYAGEGTYTSSGTYGGYGADTDTLVTSGFSSGATTGTGYPADDLTLGEQSAGVPTSGLAGVGLGPEDESPAGYSPAPEYGEPGSSTRYGESDEVNR